MTRKEFERRQRKMRARRRKAIRQHMMIACGALLVVIIVLVAAVGPLRRAKKSEALAETTAEASFTITPLPTQDPAMTPAAAKNLYNPYTGEIDRSNFAVDPALPCGTNHINEEDRIVYLTLDDGPSYLTPQYLDVLDKYGVKATFFVTAQAPEYFYLIKEAYDRGHTIGLHSYTHDYATVYASADAFFADLDQIGQIVKEQIGYVPCFIRFPGGSANYISHDYTPGIMTYLTEEVQKRGYQYFDWNCSSGDGAQVDDPNQLVAAATSSEWDTTVLLSHDSGGKETTLEALPKIIEYYLENGYEFRPITREAYTSHQEIFN